MDYFEALNLISCIDEISSAKEKLKLITDFWKKRINYENFFIFEYNTQKNSFLKIFIEKKNDNFIPDENILTWAVRDSNEKPIKIDPIDLMINDLYFVFEIDTNKKYIIIFRIKDDILNFTNERISEYKKELFLMKILFKKYYNYKKAEKHEILFHRSSALLKAILNYSSLGYIVLNDTGLIEIITNNAKTMLSLFDNIEYVGKEFINIIPESLKKDFNYYIKNCSRSKIYTDVNLNYVNSAGVEFYLGLDFMMLDSFLMGSSAYLIIIKDLSLSREIEKLRELDQMKDDLISLISHELRTPVTSLIAYSDVLYEEIKDDYYANCEEFLKVINIEANRLNKMITEILDISRIKKGKLDLEKTPENLYNFLKEREEFYKITYKDKNINITFNVESEEDKKLYAEIDKHRFTQVIDNLINNAIKYNDKEEKKINIILYKEDNLAKIIIKDNGIGIDKKDIDKIFNYFYQIQSVMKHSEGIGLGLGICKDIIKLHNGSINVKSTPNVGSDFIISLPLVEY